MSYAKHHFFVWPTVNVESFLLNQQFLLYIVHFLILLYIIAVCSSIYKASFSAAIIVSAKQPFHLEHNDVAFMLACRVNPDANKDV